MATTQSRSGLDWEGTALPEAPTAPETLQESGLSLPFLNDLLLRTHTTATQGRFMPALHPPFRLFTLGRCFRSDAVDATHYHTFHQIDAFISSHDFSSASLL